MLEQATVFAAPAVSLDGDAIEIAALRPTETRPRRGETGVLATFDAAMHGAVVLGGCRLAARDGRVHVELLHPAVTRGAGAARLLHGTGRRALVLAAEGVYRAQLAADGLMRAAVKQAAQVARAAVVRPPARGPDVDFDAAPPLGSVLDLGGLTFELIAVEPYTRKTDGQPSALLTWRGSCAACGEPFDARTGLRARWVNKRCRRHRAPGVPATVEAEVRQRAAGGLRGGQR